MVNVPTPDEREVIARRPFLDETVGEMVTSYGDEGPSIAVHLAPEDSAQRVDLELTPSEARELAGQLLEIADIAQRAGWTPAVLADVRENYLPGASDDEIVTRLDRLTERLGHAVLGVRGDRVDWQAGRMLAAEVDAEVVERASGVIDDALGQLDAVRDAIDRLTQLRNTFAHLHRAHRSESEPGR